MSRSFDNGLERLESPALNAFAVTPNDGVDLAHVARGIYLGTSGDVTLIPFNGDQVTFKSLAAGVRHEITASRILATGTTATFVTAVY